jgi:hypothetical protein
MGFQELHCAYGKYGSPGTNYIVRAEVVCILIGGRRSLFWNDHGPTSEHTLYAMNLIFNNKIPFESYYLNSNMCSLGVIKCTNSNLHWVPINTHTHDSSKISESGWFIIPTLCPVFICMAVITVTVYLYYCRVFPGNAPSKLWVLDLITRFIWTFTLRT